MLQEHHSAGLRDERDERCVPSLFFFPRYYRNHSGPVSVSPPSVFSIHTLSAQYMVFSVLILDKNTLPVLLVLVPGLQGRAERTVSQNVKI